MANNGEKKSNFSRAATWVKNNKLEAAGLAAMAVPVVGVAGWAARGVYTAGKFAWKARKIHAKTLKAKALKTGKAIGKYTQPTYRKTADWIGPKHKTAKAGKTFKHRAHAERARTTGKQASWRHKTIRLKDKKYTVKTKADKKKGLKGGTRTYTEKQYGIRPSFGGVATSKTAIGGYGLYAYTKSQPKAKPQGGTQTGNGKKSPPKPTPKKNGTYKSVESEQGKLHTPGSVHGSRLGPITYDRSATKSRFQQIVNQSKKRLGK
jgi:hypothetical protein